MESEIISPFTVMGIAVRTTNENDQSSRDIPALWNKFMAEGIMQTIPNRVDSAIYCIYTDYEKDHTAPYTAIIGCRVTRTDFIPERLVAKEIEGGVYIKRVAKGDLSKGVVFDEWIRIWNADLPRAYTADFEVYGEKAQRPEEAEVTIFLAMK